jgi:hypothetical protein
MHMRLIEAVRHRLRARRRQRTALNDDLADVDEQLPRPLDRRDRARPDHDRQDNANGPEK